MRKGSVLATDGKVGDQVLPYRDPDEFARSTDDQGRIRALAKFAQFPLAIVSSVYIDIEKFPA